jgi:hypothetical protein
MIDLLRGRALQLSQAGIAAICFRRSDAATDQFGARIFGIQPQTCTIFHRQSQWLRPHPVLPIRP